MEKEQAITEEEKNPEAGAEEAPKSREELKKMLEERMEEIRKRGEDYNEILRTGRGILKLETPFTVSGKEITELGYDFTTMTGMEYTDAMDSDPNARINYARITYRQALALFAKAAAKETEKADMDDIIENIGMTDAMEGSKQANLFFMASTRAGRLRISKK